MITTLTVIANMKAALTEFITESDKEKPNYAAAKRAASTALTLCDVWAAEKETVNPGFFHELGTAVGAVVHAPIDIVKGAVD